jgi:GH25 family lysozyme M1 (1,4-beta-N-acetylmuramidase)
MLVLLGLAFVAEPGRAVAQNRPMGTDVSSYQGGGIDWTNVKKDGIYFAWTKATEGVDYEDADFAINEVNAKAAGVFIGAYHFAHYDLPNGPVVEANYFWAFAKNYIKNDTLTLVPMLDVEVTPTNGSTAAIVSTWVNTWCSNVVALGASNGLVLHPVVYTGTSFAGEWLNSSVTQWSAWLAAYPDCTSNASCQCEQCGSPTPQTSNPGSWNPWSTWNLWQYGDTNWSGGDSDVFNGTTNQFLQLFLVGSTNAPRITTNPATMTVAQGADATFSVSVSGGTPLYYHWQFDGTNAASVTNFNTNSVSYAITNVQLTNAGNYAVQVTNAYGAALSSTAFLSVTAPLSNAAGSIIAPAGLVNWWPANGNAIDIVNTNNGLPANGFFYAPGKSGLAFHFDGSTSYLTMTNSPADVAVPWTACLWVYRQQTPQTSAALLSDGTYTLKLEQYSDTHDVGMTQLSVEDWIFTNSSGAKYSVPLQTWTHLAFVASGSGASALTTLYANGAQQGILNTNLPLGRLTMGATDVSGTGYVDYLEGSMDEVMIFNKALTAAQIQSIYNAGASGLVQAPDFLGVSTAANGNLTFSLEGLTGSKNFMVYSSTNLANWSILSTISAATGSNQFTVSPTNAASFYRAIQP